MSTRRFVNEISNESPAYDGVPYSGNAIALNENGDSGQYVDLDINHQLGENTVEDFDFTLGSEIWFLVNDTLSTLTYAGDKMTFAYDSTDNAYVYAIAPNLYNISSDTYKITVAVTAITETTSFGDGYKNWATIDSVGTHEIICNSPQTTSLYIGRGIAAVDSSIEIDSITVEEITTHNSYLTFTDTNADSIETIACQDDGGNSYPNLVSEATFDTDYGDWIAYASTIAVVDSTLEITSTLPSVWGRAYHNISCEIGRVYGVVAEGKYGTTTSSKLGFLNLARTVNLDSSTDFNGDTWTTARLTAIADETTHVVQYATNDSLVGSTTYLDNVSVGEVLPNSTTYRMTKSFSNAFAHDKPFSDADRAAMAADQELIMRVWLDGETLPSGFSKADMLTGPSDYNTQYDIEHTLGAELADGVVTSSSSIIQTTITDGYNLVGTATSLADWIGFSCSTLATYSPSLLTITLNSGSVTLSWYYSATHKIPFPTPIVLTTGENIIEMPAHYSPTLFALIPQTGSTFDIDILSADISIQAIANPNSCITVMDADSINSYGPYDAILDTGFIDGYNLRFDAPFIYIDGELADKGTDNSTVYNSPKVYQTVFTSTIPLTDADRAELLADRQLVYEVAKGNDTLTSGFSSTDMTLDATNKGTRPNYLPCCDVASEEYIQDLGKDIGANVNTYSEVTDINSSKAYFGAISFDTTVKRSGGTGSLKAVGDGSNIQTVIQYKYGVYEFEYAGNLLKFTAWIKTDTEYLSTPSIRHGGSGGAITNYHMTLIETDINGWEKWEAQGVPIPDNGRYDFFMDARLDGNIDGVTTIWVDGPCETFVVDENPAEIQGYTSNCRDFFKNKNEGMQAVMFTRDAFGRPLATTTAGVIQMDDENTINFGLVVTAEASINYVCTGLLEDLDASGVGLGTYTQRTELRVLEYKVGETTKYSIDGTLQGYTPTLPAQSLLILGNTAFIGHPDTIDSINTPTEKFQYFSVYGAIIV